MPRGMAYSLIDQFSTAMQSAYPVEREYELINREMKMQHKTPEQGPTSKQTAAGGDLYRLYLIHLGRRKK